MEGLGMVNVGGGGGGKGSSDDFGVLKIPNNTWRVKDAGEGGMDGEEGRWMNREGGKCKLGKKKIKSEGGGQKIKYRSVHWNNAGSLVRDNGLDQCFL